jgi:2-hydroxy-6-oxonona-2,4-dienedioate hydrolase
VHDPDAADDFTVDLHAANLVRDRLRNRKLALTDIVARNLPALTLPVHAVFGEQDALYAGRMSEVEAVLRQAPAFGGLTLIPGAGHWVQYEAPVQFNRQVLGLLD